MTDAVKYKIVNIILVDSQFWRNQIIDYTSSNIKNNVQIETSLSKNNEILSVYLTLKFDLTIDEKEVIKSKIAMVGIFECTENPELPEDTFGKINAPAIIFPFVREHLASMSLKAGIEPIILPPVNFVQLAEAKKIEEAKIE